MSLVLLVLQFSSQMEAHILFLCSVVLCFIFNVEGEICSLKHGIIDDRQIGGSAASMTVRAIKPSLHPAGQKVESNV